MVVFADPKEWWIELPTGPTSATPDPWRSLPYSQPGRQWEAYLSSLCLQHLVPWLQATYDEVRPWLNAADWPGIWEWVGGCAVQMGARRLILMPSDAIASDSLVVPQEWVDLPDWAGDYYLAVQIQTDPTPALRVWGYADHRTLKQAGDYDDTTRTYTLDAHALTPDLSSLALVQRFCPDLETRAAIAPLAPLPSPQAINLSDRLSNPSLRFPRLSLPFSTWGALLQDPNWRQQLYRQRNGQASAPNLPVRLNQWLEGLVETGWQSIESLFGNDLAPQLRRLEQSFNVPLDRQQTVHPAAETHPIRQAKMVTVQDAQELISLALVVTVTPLANPALAPGGTSAPTLQIQVQLHPLQRNTLPANLVLELHDPQQSTPLQTLQTTTADTYIQLNRFRAESGESFQIWIRSGTVAAGGEAEDSLCETFLV